MLPIISLLFGCVLAPQISALRVVGGGDAMEGQFPHMLSLRVNGVHSCGASLVSATKGVTVAHCTGGSISSYSVLAGALDRSVSDCATCHLRSAVLVSRHPNFANNPSAGYPNDVAALRFDTIEGLTFALLAAPADGTFEEETCVFAGWGRTTPGGALPAILQYGEMSVISMNDCIAQWGASRIYQGQICTTSTTVTTCTGDNGGPLICGGKLAGLNSWGDSQCSPTYPSVHTRVSYYRTWIEQQ